MMDRAFPMRVRGRRPFRRGLGYPILPDNFTTAQGSPWSFSPGTPDAIQMEVLTQGGQTLPLDLQAKWDAAQGTLTTTTQPAPAITPTTAPPAVTASGTPISTQTGAAVTLLNNIAVPGAPGVFQCFMSDGSSHYCDQNTNPISYTPPPPPVATPAAVSQPTSVVAPAVTPQAFLGPPVQAPPAVTPAGTQISTTTGTPAPTSAAVVSSVESTLDSLMTWLKGSLIGGIPNWLLLGGAAAGLMMFGGDGGSSRRRR
jgi:hypothetical protein